MTTTDIVPDDVALRQSRRQRLLIAMESDGVDLLVAGREANARYISGAPRLWTAGSKPFGPGCVLVRETGAVYLLSTWDEGVPDEIPHDHLFGITFNSGNLLRALKGVEGAATARTVATDALTPSSARLLAAAFPAATIVDGSDLLARARTSKTPEEVDAIRAAVAVAHHALVDATAAVAVGVTARQLTGVFMASMATQGVTTPVSQDVAWITVGDRPWGRAPRDTPAVPGHLVAFDAGVLRGGYVGELGRTTQVGEASGPASALDRRREELLGHLLEACRPGAPLSTLLDAYAKAGEPLPPMPIARGLGLGYDLPLATHELPLLAQEQQLEEGMVLAVIAYLWEEGVGGMYHQEPVVLTASGPELLTANTGLERRESTT